MTTVRDVQRALLARGYDIGKSRDDGLIGPATLAAALAAIERLPISAPAAAHVAPVVGSVIPADWMPWCQMLRIVFHWTAGGNKASLDDRKHYHVLFEGDGNVVRGVPSIVLNDAPVKKGYAAHTLNLNGDAIGTSLCGMTGAQESPFKPGDAPITERSWDKMVLGHVDLCRRYAIPVTRKTLLSHAEVQPTLGVKQRGKWDVAVLPWDRSVVGAIAIGDRMRAQVLDRL